MTVYIPHLGKIKAKTRVIQEIQTAFSHSADALEQEKKLLNLANHHRTISDALLTNILIKKELEEEC